MEIQYTGEHLFVGHLGNFFVILSFAASLLATIFYFLSSGRAQSLPIDHKGRNWKKIARLTFYFHSAFVVLIASTLFYMLFNHYYEYQYVWEHSNNEMPLRYIFSCFWEGQEGSFLLWVFWNAVLGNILIYSLKKNLNINDKKAIDWEGPVLAIFASVQVFLTSMLLGIKFGSYNIGHNPFTRLLRENPDFANAPVFQNPNYLELIDGRGLNPLLQNYWMTIHPPILFLGFALTLVPFCFALAALWKKYFHEWLTPALPWAYFGIALLGIGILMGGAWAYEALSFGGFWAWDPVENASLVPWITLVGAGHLMLIYKKKGTSSGILFLLPIITFILILYSTFLTRSGILGESSVHSFTDLGMSGHLLVYLLFYLFISLLLFFIRLKDLPQRKEEDALWSREFWILIGSFVLLISAFQITFTTSLPVINAVLGTKYAPPINPVGHYNAWQVPIAIIVALIIGLTQHLKYSNTDFKQYIRKIIVSVFLALSLTIVFAYLIGMLEIKNILYIILLFSSLFAMFSNLDYFIRLLNGKIAKAGSSFAHVGIGLILLGALISQSQQKNISSNETAIDVSQIGKELDNKENILLFINDTVKMGDYFVSYKGKRKEGVNIFYEVEYLKNNEAGIFSKEFTLFPRVQTNPRMGNVSEPDTRHFLGKDIYTHITYAELNEANGANKPETFKISVGDTIFSSDAIIVLEDISTNIHREKLNLNDSDIAMGAFLKVTDVKGKQFSALPVYVLRNNFVFPMLDEIPELGLKISFTAVYPDEKKVDIVVLDSRKTPAREFIIMKAIVFPFINVLWLGCILFLFGTLLSVYQRVSLKKNSEL